MVITIAKAYKRGGNVACVPAADMFLTEVSSSIIIHRSEELMLPYVDGSGSEHYTSYSDTISAVSGEKSEDGVTSRTLKDYYGTSRFVISEVIPSAGWTLSYAMDSSEHYKDAHNIIIFFRGQYSRDHRAWSVHLCSGDQTVLQTSRADKRLSQ